MKIVKLVPNGFCYGVIKAYNETMKIIENNKSKKIYILGWLVHNFNVINQLTEANVVTLNDTKKSRYDLINEFGEVQNSILILSAHGTDTKTIDLAIKKGFEVHDLTCKYVYKTHHIVKQKLKDGYKIIFIGKNNHPETISILKINDQIQLIENVNDINKITYSDKLFCTNQTTLSLLYFQNIIDKLQKKFPHIEIQNDICDATTMRQKAVLNMSDDVQLCIVVGDTRSSNSNELFKLAQTKCPSYMINHHSELKKEWFENINTIALTAGASTPSFTIKKIEDKILEITCD